MSKKRGKVEQAPKVTPQKKAARPRVTKLGQLEAMLRKPEGATIEQLGKALDWQPHSVRGAIAGALKKMGNTVTSERPENGPRVYRIV